MRALFVPKIGIIPVLPTSSMVMFTHTSKGSGLFETTSTMICAPYVA